MLRVEHAYLSYRKQNLFSDLNLEIAEGEWVAILGKSGVGKTSLLRMLAGLTKKFPEAHTEISGNICWQGREDVHLAVAYMAQQDGLFPWLSVLDNVLVAKDLCGDHVDIHLAQEVLARVGLSMHMRKKPALLSGGMRQRVVLARTLFQNKAVVVMDEPFSSLDALTRLEMQNLLVAMLYPQQKTLVMVTHDPWEALRLADRLIVLSGAPARIVYELTLPKSAILRAITPELLEEYTKILAALKGDLS